MEKFIKELTLGAGKILGQKFRKVGVNHTKADALDVVTKADLAAEKFIISRIKKKFPQHQIISEESGDNKLKSDHLWVIDPLDGTLNFARGIPTFVSQIAYIEKGQIMLSALYDPINKELFFAQKGKGAFCNGKRIHCSQNTDFKNSLPTVNAYFNTKTIKLLNKIITATRNNHFRLRNIGTIGMAGCYTANGAFDYFISNSGNFWDYAPPYLILKEAGCEVKNFRGQNWKFTDQEFLAGNKILVNSVLRALAK